MKETCGNCKFINGYTKRKFECRAHPRTIVVIEDTYNFEYPDTSVTDWCGEWKSKESGESCDTFQELYRQNMEFKRAIHEIAPWISASLNEGTPCQEYQDACDSIFKLDTLKESVNGDELYTPNPDAPIKNNLKDIEFYEKVEKAKESDGEVIEEIRQRVEMARRLDER